MLNNARPCPWAIVSDARKGLAKHIAHETHFTVLEIAVSFTAGLPLQTIYEFRQDVTMGLGRKHITATPYAWPHDGSFSRETTALVLIDMQRDC